METPVSPLPLMTSKEIAPLLGVSWQIVGRWKREGRIPAAIDEPGCLRFDLVEVRKALAARAAEAVKHQHA